MGPLDPGVSGDDAWRTSPGGADRFARLFLRGRRDLGTILAGTATAAATTASATAAPGAIVVGAIGLGT
ncbi:MAG: hypothetical protein ACTS8Z_03230, partial [Candidatus Limnocylindrales bacterium]